MRVLVIGANGQTGRRIVTRLQEGPHEPVAMIRNPDQAGHFEEMGVATVMADLEEPLDRALKASAAEALIFAAGSGADTGPDKTLAVDRDGAIRSIAAMEAAGLHLPLHAGQGNCGRAHLSERTRLYHCSAGAPHLRRRRREGGCGTRP